jgi:dipeptidyl aminopeptidase/acylaminoacyl peptidase
MGDVSGLVLRQGIRLVLLGTLLGLLGYVAVSRFLRSLVFEISPLDPVSLLLGPVVLVVVATIACWLPARRAAAVHPMEALREECGPGEWLEHEHSVWRVPSTGSGKSVELNPGHDRWVMNMVGSDTTSSMGALIDVYHDGEAERVVFGSDEDGCYRLYSMPAKGGPLRAEFDGPVSVLGMSVGAGAKAVAACIASTTRDTGELYRVPLDGSLAAKPLSKHTAPFFKPLRFREPEEVRVKNGKVDLQAWVLKPPNFREGKKYPCLIEVHGGPMTQYGQAWFHEMQVLAAQGWVVAYCNPRGSSGRGMKISNVIDGRWGTDDWSDVQALTSWMARRPYVDASRVGILGGSYGGFMTTWALGHTNRYKAGVTQRQAGDWHVMFGSSDFGFYDIYSLKCYPWEDPMAYHRASPNFYVKSIKSPLLIVHSEEDYRCPIAQGDALFTAMKVLDQAPCELVRFEGESHGLSRGGRPKNREERLKRIVDWFQRYL